MIKRIVRSALVIGLLVVLSHTSTAQDNPEKLNLTLKLVPMQLYPRVRQLIFVSFLSRTIHLEQG